MPAERLIVLSVSEVRGGAGPEFLFHVRLDGSVVAANCTLSAVQTEAVRDVARQYTTLFEQETLPQLAKDRIKELGCQLFDLWLGSVWQRIAAKLRPGDRQVLVIATEVADVLNLPWELLGPAGGECVGADANWSVRRLPGAGQLLSPAADALPAGPLRVFFMVCAPLDQAPLDYEREEEFLVGAMARVGPTAVFDNGDLGTFDELSERIAAFRPHVVHLSGHGVVRDGEALFAFENERGRSDWRPAREIAQLFAGSGVQCAFLSGCQTGQAPPRVPLGGLCQELVAGGVPLVIGWAASVLDEVAARLAGTFYERISVGQAVDRSLVQARQAVRREYEQRGDPSWSLPVLYAMTTQSQLFDLRTREERSSGLVQQPLPGMVDGYTEHFVGCRRELQRLLPDLRLGRLQAVILSGLGGAGKSVLATRLARKLEADGFMPLAVLGTPEMPLTITQVLETCGDAFLAAGQRDDHAILRDDSLPVGERLRTVVTGLNQGRYVLVVDRFDSSLDEGTHRVLDDELAAFYRHLLGNLSGGSRVIITSRYLPAEVEPLPGTVVEMALGEFSEAAFLKLLLRDPVVNQRYVRKELPHDLMVHLYRVLGGTPRFLVQLRDILKTISTTELGTELGQLGLPDDGQRAPGKLQSVRNAYCEAIGLGRLYGRLEANSQRMLGRAAVYGIPVTVEGVSAATGMAAEPMRQELGSWQRLTLVYSDAGPDRELWSIHGPLRSWFQAQERLSMEERREAHRAAGDFLAALAEAKRAGELGMTWMGCLNKAREHYLAAGDQERVEKLRLGRLPQTRG
jgi:hypothetical protein